MTFNVFMKKFNTKRVKRESSKIIKYIFNINVRFGGTRLTLKKNLWNLDLKGAFSKMIKKTIFCELTHLRDVPLFNRTLIEGTCTVFDRNNETTDKSRIP